ncbi:MAG: hypothetical protein AAFZ01_05920 [Pseudomonadota bacterium]
MHRPAPAEKHMVPARVTTQRQGVQLSYARPVSRSGGIGFTALTFCLAALTFAVTTGSLAVPADLMTRIGGERAPSVVVVPSVVRVDVQPDVLEPKTVARLPVFGGLTPVD